MKDRAAGALSSFYGSMQGERAKGCVGELLVGLLLAAGCLLKLVGAVCGRCMAFCCLLLAISLCGLMFGGDVRKKCCGV